MHLYCVVTKPEDVVVKMARAQVHVSETRSRDAQPTKPKEKLTRTLSASMLRDGLSKLATTPLNVPNPLLLSMPT